MKKLFVKYSNYDLLAQDRKKPENVIEVITKKSLLSNQFLFVQFMNHVHRIITKSFIVKRNQTERTKNTILNNFISW